MFFPCFIPPGPMELACFPKKGWSDDGAPALIVVGWDGGESLN